MIDESKTLKTSTVLSHGWMINMIKAGEKMNNLEQRSYNFQVNAEQNERGSIITGRPIVYNHRTDLGLFDEVIESNALMNTDLTDVRFLVNHDVSKIPLARSRRNNGNSTMKLSPDNEGMQIEVILDTENNSEARALYSAVQRGDISGMSFMFAVSDEEWENLESDHPTRHIRAISTVVEVSAVTFPAYESTEINARSKEALDNARSTLDKVRQQNAISVDTDEIELLKEKTKILGGM
jgi:HK97 family phage prohead protease